MPEAAFELLKLRLFLARNVSEGILAVSLVPRGHVLKLRFFLTVTGRGVIALSAHL